MTIHSARDARSIVFLDDLPTSEGIADLTFTLDELAKEFAVTPRAIRSYEERGFLQPQHRGEQRLYSQRDRVTLEQILRARRFGLSLADLDQHLTGSDGPFGSPTLVLPPDRCRARIAALKQERAAIDQAIRDLEDLASRMRR